MRVIPWRGATLHKLWIRRAEKNIKVKTSTDIFVQNMINSYGQSLGQSTKHFLKGIALEEFRQWACGRR